MRRSNSMRGRWTIACAAILWGIVAAPASGVTNLYAPQSTGPLSQFAVAADGSLSALAPAALNGTASDIAITPDGRYAYVTRALTALTSGPQAAAAGTVEQFTRGVDGRMEPASSVAGGSDPLGILVNPQGTRVIYANCCDSTLHTRPIGAGGALGEFAPTVLAGAPRFLAMTPSGTSLYVGAQLDGGSGGVAIFQFDVDPATGSITPKPTPSVGWPTPPSGTNSPFDVARMTVAPDGRQLYVASGESATGVAHFAIDPSGALVGGSVEAIPGDFSATNVTAVSPGGQYLWAPTGISRAPGYVRQFAIAAAGTLSPLAPASVLYTVDSPARDAIVHPDGRSLYLSQDANVSEWTVAANGTLTARADRSVTGTSNAGIALAPSQAPIASFSAAPQPAGQATTFDAGASTDPDGTIARYDWDFGDGATLPNGGAAPSHVYPSAGDRTVTLTVTDADGTSTSQLWTGTQMLRNGGPSAQTTRGVSIAAPAAAAPPPPPPAGPQSTPTPEKGKIVTIVATQGKVKVKVPGSTRYVDVSLLREIPLGSRIDARKGRVRVTAEVDAKTGKTQSSLFYDGIFVVTQTTGSKPFLVARLVGGTFAGCAPRRVAARSAAVAERAGLVRSAATKRKRSKRKVRRLWGRGQGDFRTTGRRSSATVRGTWWLVEDRCDGTLTRVRQGRVDVRDIRLKKTIKLRSGGRSQYLAKAP